MLILEVRYNSRKILNDFSIWSRPHIRYEDTLKVTLNIMQADMKTHLD